jgi:hypothetical protein
MQLNVLYTANIRGQLDLLPRLYTLLRRLRGEAEGRTLLLDAGYACDAAIWHCAWTGGRSALLVLDAMGYTAANGCGFLSDEGRARLVANRMGMAVLCAGEVWAHDGVVITTGGEPPSQPHELHVILDCGTATHLEHNKLRLANVEAGQVAVVQVGGTGQNGHLAITRHEVLTLSPDTPPDSTIAATVDFVRSEADYHRRRGDTSDFR